MTRPARRRPPRHLLWLLWLALLLPSAQTAAAVHALSHPLAERARDTHGKQGTHDAPCALCLAGASLGGAALPGHAPTLPAVHAQYALAQAAPVPAPGSRPIRRYLSQAPPPITSN